AALGDQVDRVVAAPVGPALRDYFAGFGVEGDAKAVGGARIGVVGGGHAEVHDRVAFLARELLVFPDVIQEALDAAVVQAAFEFSVAGNGLAAGLAFPAAVLREFVQGV